MTSRSPPPRPINQLKYHRRNVKKSDIGRRFPVLTAEARQCLFNLASYRTKAKPRLKFPRSRCAAVLVALFVGRSGELYVLLSRRAATLRTYAGDTALPGGKVDPTDRTFEDTARREAYEEVGLPLDKRKVPLLCVLEPIMASNQLVVTPVVVLITDNTIRPILNDAEVSSLFSHPLKGFISSEPPLTSRLSSRKPVNAAGPSSTDSYTSSSSSTTPTASTTEADDDNDTHTLELPYHTARDWTVSGPNGVVLPIRTHQFLTGREAGGTKPVFGLTASILISAASIAYDRQPDFEVQPPGAPTPEQRIAWVMYRDAKWRAACEEEKINVDWERVKGIAEEDLPRLERHEKNAKRGRGIRVVSKL
ncbi:hypothetical protein CYLTODRAFT_421634 [Cylindrobasidium torrendii FP15055 ss-10]|uniref:Nudix hydrolase domain-containing protein n=1 Tax=Cylindrobasidium torrendii FP15055 ss-10 TaxID=1314674 RepID=A0A0D7BD15_9AGAR|nr:hypothetical protein CYLTODRAFT_421634 [Cylindrobasidium torrendii FP15055 ss-10]